MNDMWSMWEAEQLGAILFSSGRPPPPAFLGQGLMRWGTPTEARQAAAGAEGPSQVPRAVCPIWPVSPSLLTAHGWLAVSSERPLPRPPNAVPTSAVGQPA